MYNNHIEQIYSGKGLTAAGPSQFLLYRISCFENGIKIITKQLKIENQDGI